MLRGAPIQPDWGPHKKRACAETATEGDAMWSVTCSGQPGTQPGQLLSSQPQEEPARPWPWSWAPASRTMGDASPWLKAPAWVLSRAALASGHTCRPRGLPLSPSETRCRPGMAEGPSPRARASPRSVLVKLAPGPALAGLSRWKTTQEGGPRPRTRLTLFPLLPSKPPL